ncbi:MAG: hypothetical protein Kow0077_15490 [Anaerolineae bacterium]
MRRIIGLLLIVRALIPILAIIVIIWGATRVAADFRTAVEPPVARFESSVDDLTARLDTARTRFESARAEISAALDVLGKIEIPNLRDLLPDSISLPGITIPDISILIPTSVSVTWSDFSYVAEELVPQDCGVLDFLCDGVSWVVETVTKVARYPSGLSVRTSPLTLTIPDLPELSLPMPPLFDGLQDLLDDLFGGIFGGLEAALSSFRALGDTLQTVPRSLERIGAAVDEVAVRFGALLDRWQGLLLLVGGSAGLLLAVNVVVPMLDDFQRGWRMLFRPAPSGP